MPVSTLLHKFHKMIHSIINSNFIIALYKPRHLITHSSHTVTVKRQSDKNCYMQGLQNTDLWLNCIWQLIIIFLITWSLTNESLQEI